MPPKGANLQATDLLEVSVLTGTGYDTYSITGQEIINAASGGGGGSGTVTSVDLTMPSAFTVTGNPVTTSGTLAVAGAGVATQYIRGDGQLANFPTTTGGGASVSYYLNGSVSQGTFGGVAMKEINKTPIIGTGTDFTINANGYIQSFITDANDPSQLSIPGGNWNFETYFSASSSGGTPSFYVELYKWDGATLTLIASNSTAPEGITGGTAIDLYLTTLAVPQTTLALTDRLAVRIYVNNSGRTIKLHTEDNHLSQIITTFSTGLTALNGLTAQVQNLAVGTSGTDFAINSTSATHTFNLPTASATNRGALSSADWSTFNGKQNTLTQASALALLGFYSYRITTASASHTGTLIETQIWSKKIDANSFNNTEDLFDFLVQGIKPVTTANVLMYVRLGTTSTMPSGATGIIGQNSLTATQVSGPIDRHGSISSGTLRVMSRGSNLATDLANASSPGTTSALTFDFTTDLWIFVSVQLVNVADSIQLTRFYLRNF
jgi:hypothetical protein